MYVDLLVWSLQVQLRAFRGVAVPQRIWAGVGARAWATPLHQYEGRRYAVSKVCHHTYCLVKNVVKGHQLPCTCVVCIVTWGS
jgi:nitrite reductase/ring-hydroxylating ferredoxin subunit